PPPSTWAPAPFAVTDTRFPSTVDFESESGPVDAWRSPPPRPEAEFPPEADKRDPVNRDPVTATFESSCRSRPPPSAVASPPDDEAARRRSEERRVGKECDAGG